MATKDENLIEKGKEALKSGKTKDFNWYVIEILGVLLHRTNGGFTDKVERSLFFLIKKYAVIMVFLYFLLKLDFKDAMLFLGSL